MNSRVALLFAATLGLAVGSLGCSGGGDGFDGWSDKCWSWNWQLWLSVELLYPYLLISNKIQLNY